MDTNSKVYIKGAMEALLFINEKPITAEQIKDALEAVEIVQIRNIMFELMKDYEKDDRGMVIAEIAGGYQMLSNSHYAEFIRNFLKTKIKEKLTKPSLETLAIIAYKQPVTRADVEVIRGVNSDGVVAHLLSKGLIRATGRKDVPGRPFLYGTTREFLEYFGLKSLRDMPRLEGFASLLEAAEKKIETLNAEPDNEEEAVELGGSEKEAQASQGEIIDLKKAMEEVEAEQVAKQESHPRHMPIADNESGASGENSAPDSIEEDQL